MMDFPVSTPIKKSDTHTITVSQSDTYLRPFLVSCSCGLLHMDTNEADVGRLVRSHWDWVNRKG
jgi:hypothetical protein